jgi:ABC-type nitrate/sulfonate/bicarbonate transport system substrate-binding protein
MRIVYRLMAIVAVVLIAPTDLFAQAKGLKDLNTSYPLGGSSSYFWVAYRSGSFEKHGLRLKPIFIPGGVTAIQSLLAKELFIQLTAGPSAIRAWARRPGGHLYRSRGQPAGLCDRSDSFGAQRQRSERKKDRRQPTRRQP